MSKFNTKPTTAQRLLNHPDLVTNNGGGMAFAMKAKDELNTRVLSSFYEPKYYENKGETNVGLFKSIREVLSTDPEYILKLAAFARNEFHLRSLPLVLLNEFANSGEFVYGSRKYVPAVVQRADELTELMALSLHTRTTHPEKKFKGKRQSMFIKNGLKAAIGKFDAYQLSKYNRDGEVSLKDVIFLTHPKADTEEKQKVYQSLIDGTISPADTWEVYISANGSSKENWQHILPKMGFMAILRNLNNFLKNDVDLTPVIARLTDPKAVSKSKQYPFRFYSAWKAIQTESDFHKDSDKVNALQGALNTAMELSVANVPKMSGRTLILVDASGSMTSCGISQKSSATPAEVAGLFGAIASKMCESSDVVAFAEFYGGVFFNGISSILDRMDKIRAADVGYATYAHKPMAHARAMKAKYDRVFLFSDMQCYTEGYYGDSFAKEFLLYQREVNPNAYLYSFDLTGYGSMVVPDETPNVCTLSGFNDKVFNFIPAFETDKAEMIRAIAGYQID